jgi:hypothetical protein
VEALRVHIHLGSKQVAHTLDEVKATVSGLRLSRRWQFTDSMSPESESLASSCDIFIAILDKQVSQHTWREYKLAAKFDKIRIVLVAQAAIKSSLEIIRPFLDQLGPSVPWMPYNDPRSLRRRLGQSLVSELMKHVGALGLDHDLQALDDYEARLERSTIAVNSEGDTAFFGGRIDKRKGGPFFDKPGVVVYQDSKETLIPGTVHEGSLFPAGEKQFYQAVKIGPSILESPTIIGGDIVRNQVELGDCCCIAGSVLALEDVRLGSHLTVDGSVIAFGTVFLEGDCAETTNICAREVRALGNCHVRQNLICESLVTEESNPRITSENLKVEGAIASGGNITLGEGYNLVGVFVDGDLVLESSIVAEFAICTGRLFIAEECAIGCAVGTELTIGPRSKVKVVIARDVVQEIGDSAQIGILYTNRGIGRIGCRASIGNSNLLSRAMLSEIKLPIRVGQRWYEDRTYLSVLSNNRAAVLGNGSAIGNLLSDAIDAELYSLLSSYADFGLTLPARIALP